MPAGQPTKYKPEYCEHVIKFMSKGASVVEFAAEVHVSKETVYKWARTIDEFSDALQEAQTKSQSYLERHGRLAMVGKLFEIKDGIKTPINLNENLYKFTMTKRFRDWGEKHSIELTGKDGGPVRVEQLTDEELQKQILELTEALKK